MKCSFVKSIAVLQAVSFFAAVTLVAWVQPAAAQKSPDMTPPNILVVQTEMLKPGLSGRAHQKTESAFVQAMASAKSPVHYFGADSMSGPTRALFFMGFDSYADWQKAMEPLMQDTTLGAAFDSASEADGKLLSSFATLVFRYQPDMSVNPGVDLAQMRFVEITVITIKPGHDAEWQQLAKLHDQAYGKVPGMHYAMWEEVLGNESGGEYIVTAPLQSLAELDTRHAGAVKAWKAVSADQKQKMRDLESSSFQSIHTNLYAFNPKMSYVRDAWKSESPDFWGKQ
jgi:hypothetical protein